jgi:hypothetical protein
MCQSLSAFRLSGRFWTSIDRRRFSSNLQYQPDVGIPLIASRDETTVVEASDEIACKKDL